MALRRSLAQVAQQVLLLQNPATVGGALPAVGSELGLAAVEGCRHASNQAVKQRIRAIKNIGKITKAMKMVAASKMRNAQTAVEGSRGIVQPFYRLLGDYPAIPTNKSLTVAVTSDRGLCGGLNSSISKYTRSMVQLFPPVDADGEQDLAVVGEKGRSQLQRTHPKNIKLTVAEAYKQRVTFNQVSLIVEELLKLKPEATRVIFNKFQSAISYKPTVATVLSPEGIQRQLTLDTGNKLDTYDLEIPAEMGDMLKDLSEFQLAVTLHNALLENNCSEHASRMSAMENSSKSASEILARLTLAYNRKRQASITTELIEIIAGAAALVEAE